MVLDGAAIVCFFRSFSHVHFYFCFYFSQRIFLFFHRSFSSTLFCHHCQCCRSKRCWRNCDVLLLLLLLLMLLSHEYIHILFFHFVQFLLMFLVRLANGNKMLSFRQTVSNPCSVVVCSLIVASVLAVVGVYGSKAWLLHERYKQIEMRKRNQTNIKLFLSHGFYLFVLSQHTTSVSIVVRWYSSDPWNFALFKLKSSIFKLFNW